jgi:hypothetical protein
MRAIGALASRVAVIATAVAIFTSCSLMNPHIKWDPPDGKVPPATEITLDYGIRYAENAKAAYMSAIGHQSELSSWLGLGLIPIAATALGLGMTGQDPTAVIVLGLTATSGYAAGTWLYSKPNQKAWLAGYNATTCAVDAISPLLYVEKNKPMIIEKREALDKALVSVGTEIGKVRTELSTIETKPPAELVEPKKLAEQRITDAEKLLTDSRETSRAAEKMLQDAAIAGVTLKQTVDRISGLVSQQIIDNAPDIQAMATLIGGLAQSYGQFVSVPEAYRPKPPSGVTAQAGKGAPTAVTQKVESLQKAISNLEGQMIVLQNAAISVAEIVNAVTASKPIDTLKACGAKIEQIAQPITVEPSGRIELQQGKATTVGRVIRGGSAPFAVALQGDTEGPVVRQTEPFGPAFTVQITEKTPAKEYSIYISDKAGQKLFIAVDVKSGTDVGSGTANVAATGDPLSKAANELTNMSFELQNPSVNVNILKAQAVNNTLEVDVEIVAKSGQTTSEIVGKVKDTQLKDEMLKLKPLKGSGIKKEQINVRIK